MLQLSSPGGLVHAVIDPDAGGRLASLTVAGLDLLVARDPSNHPFGWGSYVMAPFAGRLRRGRFDFDGQAYEMPATLGEHAIHGVAYARRWRVVSRSANKASLTCLLGPPWPFGGEISEEIELHDDAITQRVTIVVERPMPATVGWHPWFVRQLGRGSPAELAVDLCGARMYQRDDEYMPTDRLVDVPAGPWDDAFVGVGTTAIRWAGALSLTMEHDCSHVVIYDQPLHALCVEPQSDQPDAFTWAPARCRVEPGRPLTRATTWRWQGLG